MSTDRPGGPGDDRDPGTGPGAPGDPAPEDDPFAFPEDGPDGGDAAEHAQAGDDPFAFPSDGGEPPSGDRAGRTDGDGPGTAADPDPGDDAVRDGDAPDADAGGSAPGHRRRRGSRSAPAERTDEERATIRAAAEAASARAQAVGVRWLAVAGIVLVVLVGVTTLIGGRGSGTTGGDVEAGEQLPDFAAPLATEPKLKADDVNVAQQDGQGEAGKKAACSISNPSVVTSCALLRRGPLVLVLFSRGVSECVDAVDLLERQRRRFPSVQTLAVATLGAHDATAETVAQRRWTLPVAYDHDRGLSALLGAPACPLVLFVRQDGTVEKRIIGRLRPDALTAAMQELARSAAPPTGTVDSTPPGR